jgi:uncharacterized protein
MAQDSSSRDCHACMINVTRGTCLASALEIADTPARRSKGLLGRSSLGQSTGLWIVPCESVHMFGMKFAIDLVYLDRRMRVKKVRHALKPWRISACLTAHSVIELPVGAILDSRTEPGDILELVTSTLPD